MDQVINYQIIKIKRIFNLSYLQNLNFNSKDLLSTSQMMKTATRMITQIQKKVINVNKVMGNRKINYYQKFITYNIKKK